MKLMLKLMSEINSDKITMQPKVGQIWTNIKNQKQATIDKIITNDRILLRYSPHEGYDSDYDLFLQTHTIDVEKSIENLQEKVEDLLEHIEQLEQFQDEQEFPDPCPECGTHLKTKYSGVECPNPKCDYWFCY